MRKNRFSKDWSGSFSLFRYVMTGLVVAAGLVTFPVSLAIGQDKKVNSMIEQKEYPKKELELDIITVTAQKQEENVQEVPIGISVFSDLDIEDRKIESVQDIADFVPNMMILDSGMSSFSSPSMRGIRAPAASMSVSAGLYVDGVPLLTAPGFEDAILDIERIEVLRGPQGTLYGKNTEAGVINIITRQPDNEFRGKVSAEGGKLLSTETGDGLKGEFSLNVSGPIMEDRLFLGIAGRYYQKDGFVQNITTGDTANDREHWYGRGHLRWVPRDDFDISLIVSRLQYDDGGASMNRPATGAGSFGLPAPQYRQVMPNLEGKNESTSDTQSLKFTYDFTDSLTLTSISARSVFEHKSFNDYDFSPMTLMHSDIDSQYRKTSQELRLNYTGEKLRWLVGLYYDDDRDDLYFQVDSIFFPFINNKTVDGQSYAAFVNFTYPVTHQLNLVAGLRYENQEREMENNITGDKFDGSWESVTPKIAMNYSFTPSIMAYISASKGDRSGGFNMFAHDPQHIIYDGQSLWSYEIGIKSAFLDDRLILNGAVFYMEISDMQVDESISPVETYLTNAAEASGYGGELEMSAIIIDGLSLTVAIGFSDIEFDTFKDALGDYKGNQNPLSPEYTFNIGTQYRHASGFYTRVDLIGYGEMFLDKTNTASRDAFEIVNAKIGYETEQFDVYLYGKNIFDQEYDIYASSLTTYSEPGEIGLQVVYRF